MEEERVGRAGKDGKQEKKGAGKCGKQERVGSRRKKGRKG